MPAEPRDWAKFCPRRYDEYILSNPQEIKGVPLVGGSTRVPPFLPQIHNYRQHLGVIWVVQNQDATPEEAEKTAIPLLGPDGYTCTRCLSRANEQGMLVVFTGDGEEMELIRSMQEDMTRRMEEAQAAAEEIKAAMEQDSEENEVRAILDGSLNAEGVAVLDGADATLS